MTLSNRYLVQYTCGNFGGTVEIAIRDTPGVDEPRILRDAREKVYRTIVAEDVLRVDHFTLLRRLP